jgi:hypothetical protein
VKLPSVPIDEVLKRELYVPSSRRLWNRFCSIQRSIETRKCSSRMRLCVGSGDRLSSVDGIDEEVRVRRFDFVRRLKMKMLARGFLLLPVFGIHQEE